MTSTSPTVVLVYDQNHSFLGVCDTVETAKVFYQRMLPGCKMEFDNIPGDNLTHVWNGPDCPCGNRTYLGNFDERPIYDLKAVQTRRTLKSAP